jgi:hypothetical protein
VRVGRYVRFRRRDLTAYIEAHTVGGPRPEPVPLGLVRGRQGVA